MNFLKDLISKANNQKNAKHLFFITLTIIAFFLINWSLKVGMDGDGPIRIEHGKANLNYFLTLGEDTTFYDVTAYKSDIHYKHVKYYGTIIESTAIGIARLLNIDTYYYINKIRRLITTFLSIITILYIGLFAKIYTKIWSWAFIAILLAFISPTFIGYSFWQTKAAPVVSGFMISIYYIYRLYKIYPIIKYKYFIGLTCGLTLALSVRLQGLLIIFYFIITGILYIALNTKNLGNRTQIIRFVIVSGISLILGYSLGFMSYPVFWEDGYLFIFKAITVLQSHPQNPPVLFEGIVTRSQELPWYYLPKMLLITLPIYTFIFFTLAVISFGIKIKRQTFLAPFLLLFTFLFPVIYIVSSGTDLYGGWRHELFVYPSFLLFGTLGLYQWTKLKIKKTVNYTIIVISCLFIFKTGYWVLYNAPLQYFYYNEIVGGVRGAYTKYTLDDGQISNEMGLNILLNSDKAKTRELVAANTLVIHDVALPNDSTRKMTVGYINRNAYPWKYGIFNPIFISPQILEIGYPPKNTIEKIEVDGIPICCIVERKNFDDYHGIEAYNKKNFKKAYNFFIKAYEFDKNNYIIYPYLAALSFNFKHYENANIFASKQLNLFPNDKTARDIIQKIKGK